jgi:hypothetical protein
MASWRALESEKQACCREQNESVAQAPGATSTQRGERSFRCECGDRECSCPIALTLAEYEDVRGIATHFAVARHHENPESEEVIHENERFAIVETVTPDATKVARRSDPRQRRRERCRSAANPSNGQ